MEEQTQEEFRKKENPLRIGVSTLDELEEKIRPHREERPPLHPDQDQRPPRLQGADEDGGEGIPRGGPDIPPRGEEGEHDGPPPPGAGDGLDLGQRGQ